MELDLRITKDEQVILCHDEYLSRLTEVELDHAPSDYNFDELPPIRQSIHSDIMDYTYT